MGFGCVDDEGFRVLISYLIYDGVPSVDDTAGYCADVDSCYYSRGCSCCYLIGSTSTVGLLQHFLQCCGGYRTS